MKTILATMAVTISSLKLFQKCKYDKEILVPVSNCSDTANISFTERIEPQLRASCFSCMAMSLLKQAVMFFNCIFQIRRAWMREHS